MRKLNNSELHSVVGGVVAGDEPINKDSTPVRLLGESEEDYNKRLQKHLTDSGMM